MSTKRKGRSRPRSKNRKKIRYVDGFAIRNIFPDMDVVESYSSTGGIVGGMPTPFIPKGEIWIDRRFRKEKDFLLEVHRLEQLKRNWPEAKTRAYLKERLTKKGTPPPFVARSEKRGRLTVRYVRGEIVRQYFDPGFIFGGHDLVYKYIPASEIWIDIRQDPREIPYTMLHELHERSLMARGVPYHWAHRSATEEERKRRARERNARRDRPLKLRPYLQSAGYCGPASLKIAFNHFGREYDEIYLGELCGTTAELGTDHVGLVRCAEKLGAKVETAAGGTLAKLRRSLRKGLPVIVGWYSPEQPRKTVFDPSEDEPEDHFSVVYHVSERHVYLMDPDLEEGRRRMSCGRFMRLWWDTDGPDGERVDRWYMTVNFEGPAPKKR